MKSALELGFLGAGNGSGNSAQAMGNSCAALMLNGRPLLGIDFGWTAYQAWQEWFDEAPSALFITHAHLDHCGGLEALFYSLAVGAYQDAPPVRIYCLSTLVPVLHRRLAAMPSALAEGGMNFWDVFQLVPVEDTFWHQGYLFRVFANRHHTPLQSTGLALPGQFFFSGDTRPIPELVNQLASQGEPIFHDLSEHSNPSHTGVEDLFREYSASQRERMIAYHLQDEAAVKRVENRGIRVARAGDVFQLGESHGLPPARQLLGV